VPRQIKKIGSIMRTPFAWAHLRPQQSRILQMAFFRALLIIWAGTTICFAHMFPPKLPVPEQCMCCPIGPLGSIGREAPPPPLLKVMPRKMKNTVAFTPPIIVPDGSYKYIDISIVLDTIPPKLYQPPIDSFTPHITLPKYPGGDGALLRYLLDHVQYPPFYSKDFDKYVHYGSRAIVWFMVEADGSISEARIIKQNAAIVESSLRSAILAMPRWEPARYRGEPMAHSVVLPFRVCLY
jgi:hypothetical protein